jgi:hypothetical protein
MNPLGPRNQALRSPQRPATTAGGIEVPDDPNLCGPSPAPHPNRPGKRGKVSPYNLDDLRTDVNRLIHRLNTSPISP